jgi:hypothetical protein
MEMSDPPWRVGMKLGRTLYFNDLCVGMVDTKELAADIVSAMNEKWAAAVEYTKRGYRTDPNETHDADRGRGSNQDIDE